MIDDSLRNCMKFDDHFGSIVVFPQPWNGMYVDSRVKYVWEVVR